MPSISTAAARLVAEYAGEVREAHEWPNAENERRTRNRLFAYISALESYVPEASRASIVRLLPHGGEEVDRAFTGGGL